MKKILLLAAIALGLAANNVNAGWFDDAKDWVGDKVDKLTGADKKKAAKKLVKKIQKDIEQFNAGVALADLKKAYKEAKKQYKQVDDRLDDLKDYDDDAYDQLKPHKKQMKNVLEQIKDKAKSMGIKL